MNAEKEILFSIITPTFNRSNMIGKAIESVINQTYANWEMIIIDDGSTDDTAQVIKNFTLNDQRIKYFYQNNQGRSAARNKGIYISIGDFLCFLDDDDHYLDDFLLKFHEIIKTEKKSETLYMCFQYENINNKLRLIKIDQNKLLRSPLEYLIKKSNNLQQFVIPKKALQDKIFDTRFDLGEDFHLLIRILLESKLKLVPIPLCVYNNHEEMTMEMELKNGLFLKLPFNRLDVIDDILIKQSHLLKNKKWINKMLNKYNQICYFYSSSALKLCKIKQSIFYIKKLKMVFRPMLLYYIISINIRILYYKIKCNLN